MQNIPKLTPADYPDLLAAADAGTPQRELADRYDCAPSLVARHLGRARRAREPSEPARGDDAGLAAEPHSGSMRELLEARIRDPKTSPRDLAALVNALAKLDGEEASSSDSLEDALRTAARIFPLGTLVLEPVRAPAPRYRLLRRVPGTFEHIDNSLTPQHAWARRLRRGALRVPRPCSER
ncbi:MAG: hypothetical protein M3R26_00525 [Actinomycetota bacterium]|nr:hypothetical protein [Actinomycetota bacterium]MDQ2980797.1 hypothetical protein [Actinomycetota bacterium]